MSIVVSKYAKHLAARKGVVAGNAGIGMFIGTEARMKEILSEMQATGKPRPGFVFVNTDMYTDYESLCEAVQMGLDGMDKSQWPAKQGAN